LQATGKQAIRKVFLFFGAVFALLMIFIGIVGYLVTGPVARDVDANSIPITDEAAQRLDDRIDILKQQIDEATAKGEQIHVSLLITEEEATSKVQALSDEEKIGIDIKYIQIHFIDGVVHVFAKLDLVITFQVMLQAKVEVEDGEVNVKIVRFDVGRVSVPKTLIDQVMRAVARIVDERLEEDVDIDLEGITVGDGQMLVTGATK